MADNTDILYINTTAVHPAKTPFSYGTSNLFLLDWGTPDAEMFMDAVPLADGSAFRGRVTKARNFTLGIVVSDVGTAAKGQDVWGEVLALVSANNGIVDYRYVRQTGAGATIDRRLQAIVVGEPAWRWSEANSGDGLRLSGNVFITLPCVAPFPWWRDTDYTEVTLSPTGTTPASSAITRGGHLACGLEVKISTAGTLGSMTMLDGNRSLTLAATVSGTPKGIDRFYTDPHAVAVDAGVTSGIPGSLSLHSATTTITATPIAGASGAHTVRLRYFKTWKTP